MATHGKATPTQFAELSGALQTAAANALDYFDPKEVNRAASDRSRNGELIQSMRLLFTAMTTGQRLVLQPAEKPAELPLLELVTTAQTVATEKFVLADHLVVGDRNGVKVAYVNDVLKSNFLGKVEENVAAATIKVHTLLRRSLDPPIIVALGDTHEMSFAQFWQLVKAQGHGESGTLLVNGYANICYVRDTEGTLWTVLARWACGGWNFLAYSVECPDGWSDGFRVLSR